MSQITETNVGVKITETIVAVGFDVQFLDMADVLEKYRPGIKALLGMEQKDLPNWTVRSGVYYSDICTGMDTREKKSQDELESWFKRSRGYCEKIIPINTIYLSTITAKKSESDVVACEIYVGGERLYAFLLNRENKATSFQKKLIHSLSMGTGNSEAKQYTKQSIRAGTVTIRPYKHISIKTEKLTKDENGYWVTLSTEQKTIY